MHFLVSKRVGRETWLLPSLTVLLCIQVLTTSLEKYVLGCWRGLLLPSSEDPGLVQEASRLQESLQQCGWKYPDPTLLRVS